MVLDNPFENYTLSEKRRVDFVVGVGYSSDLELVDKVTKEAVEESVAHLDKEKPIEVFFKEFADSSINYSLRFWTTVYKQGEYLNAQNEAIRAITKKYREHDINIPFPIRTIDFTNKLEIKDQKGGDEEKKKKQDEKSNDKSEHEENNN